MQSPIPARRAVRSLVLVTALAAVAVACTPASPSGSTLPAATSTTTVVATTQPNPPGCTGTDAPFGSSDLVSAFGRDVGDAAVVAAIDWTVADGCERFRIGFRTLSGAPASTIGAAGVSIVPSSGIVRVTLPEEVRASAIADTLADTDLVDRIYVVRSTDQRLTIEFHLAPVTVVEARGFVSASPAEIVVDLRPGANRAVILSRPRSSGGVVLTSPPPGPNLYPLRVAGYAAPGSAAVRVRISDPDGTLDLDRSVATAAGGDAWEAFDVALSDGPGGMVELFVGAIDALGLSSEGVTVDLDLP